MTSNTGDDAPRPTCPECRDNGTLEPVAMSWDHRGVESFATATCARCGWKSRYGPI